MKTGERIRDARKKAGLTQIQLGERIGVSGAMIGQYETEIRKPKYETLSRIADALKVDIIELLPISRSYAVSESISDADQGTSIAESLEKTPVQRYTEFIADHPQLIQNLNKVGVELEIIDWLKIRIKHEYQEDEVRISELLDDLERVHSQYMYSLKALFKNSYGFDMSEED